MNEEQLTHVYHHYDERPPEVSFKVATTTRGPTWEIEVKYVTTETLIEACKLYGSVDRIIKAEVAEPEEKEES